MSGNKRLSPGTVVTVTNIPRKNKYGLKVGDRAVIACKYINGSQKYALKFVADNPGRSNPRMIRVARDFFEPTSVPVAPETTKTSKPRDMTQPLQLAPPAPLPPRIPEADPARVLETVLDQLRGRVAGWDGVIAHAFVPGTVGETAAGALRACREEAKALCVQCHAIAGVEYMPAMVE